MNGAQANLYRNYTWVWLIPVLLLFFMIDLLTGSVEIDPFTALSILFGKTDSPSSWVNILFKIRLPKAIAAVLCGAALSISGLLMQTLFRNPLAGPSILGITAGASLGVAAIVLGGSTMSGLLAIRELGWLGSSVQVLAASAGAAAVMILIMLIASRIQDEVILLIIGIMIGNITFALISIWQYISEPLAIQDYLVWTFGSLGGVGHQQLGLMACIISPLVIVLFFLSTHFDLMLTGNLTAQSSGLHLKRIRNWIIFSSSILAACVTAFCGPIGFIGLAVPHLCRVLFRASLHRVLIPACLLAGPILMLLCDIISHLPFIELNLPINAITALIGSPIVILLILKGRQMKQVF